MPRGHVRQSFWPVVLCSTSLSLALPKNFAAVDRNPKVGNGISFGAGASVLGNIQIGDGCQVGAGTLVITDLPSHSVAVGFPAKIIDSFIDRTEQPSVEMNQMMDRKIITFQTDGIWKKVFMVTSRWPRASSSPWRPPIPIQVRFKYMMPSRWHYYHNHSHVVTILKVETNRQPKFIKLLRTQQSVQSTAFVLVF